MKESLHMHLPPKKSLDMHSMTCCHID